MFEPGTKTTPVFLPDDRGGCWSLFSNSVYFLSVGAVQPEKTYSRVLKMTGQV